MMSAADKWSRYLRETAGNENISASTSEVLDIAEFLTWVSTSLILQLVLSDISSETLSDISSDEELDRRSHFFIHWTALISMAL